MSHASTARAHIELAIQHLQSNRLDAALIALQSAIKHAPDNPDVAFAVGDTLQRAGQNKLAEGVYRNILEYCPEHLPTAHNLGCLLKTTDRFEQARAQFEQILERFPDAIPTRRDLGQTEIALGHLSKGIETLEFALQTALTPSNTPNEEEIRLCRFALSLAYLRNEDWARGWPLYEARWCSDELNQAGTRWGTRWDGQCIDDQHLLVITEQGYGDSLMFSRYLPALAAETREITLLCPPPLLKLFSAALMSHPNISVCTELPDNCTHDVFTFMGSLPASLMARPRSHPQIEPPPHSP